MIRTVTTHTASWKKHCPVSKAGQLLDTYGLPQAIAVAHYKRISHGEGAGYAWWGQVKAELERGES